MADERLYDHAPRFLAIEQAQDEVSARVEYLLQSHEPQPVIVDDPYRRLLLSPEEISRLWGLFPASARLRAANNPPIINVDTPRWFAHGSSSEEPAITDRLEEALSATAHGLAHNDENYVITVHEIPENGFSQATKRLVQAGALIHEMAHTITDPELNETDPLKRLEFNSGRVVMARDWFSAFAELAETQPPISRYSAAYRNPDLTFPIDANGYYLGTPVVEEMVECINAELLGYIVNMGGLTFEPFAGHGTRQVDIQRYLQARAVQEAIKTI